MSASTPPWTRCDKCKRCEWNSILSMNQRKCPGCHTVLTLYKKPVRGTARFDLDTESDDFEDFYECEE
eukprot:1696125-Pyramimonas_sp.AAC.1